MDWNWFFSSLSQSAAAIVGIFGAFIITKILSNQVSYSEKVNKCRDTLTKCRRVKDSASDLYFNWYNKHTNKRQYERLNDFFEDENYLPPEHYYDKLDFSIFSPRESVIEEIKSSIINHQEQMKIKSEEFRKRAANHQRLNKGSAFFEVTQPRMPSISHFNVEMVSKLQKEREAIDSVIRDTRHHMRLASDMLDSVKGNPESSPQITYALVLVTLLFFIGVIYPLSFLPADPKGNFNLSFSAFLPLLFTVKGIFYCHFQ
ncbi:MAG: hypothetical protein Q9N67_00740 [Ghiorsea sp.]|nr:hypothetical protein [Ghiorsea sp.]